MATTEKERLDYLIGKDTIEEENVAAEWGRYLKMNNYSICFPSFLSDAFYEENSSEKKYGLRSEYTLNADKDLHLRKVNSKACENIFDKVITIRVKPNNTFCTLRSSFHDQVISSSSTKYNVKMSKKSLRYNYKIVLKAFLKEVNAFIKSDKILFSITAPRKIRRELLRILKVHLEPIELDETLDSDKIEQQSEDICDNEEEHSEEPTLVVFKLNAKKCFNGCRVRKKKRKKQRGLRIYK
jgi:ribosomal protein S11